MNTQFHKGVIEMCILSLVRNKDRYGYELVETISNHVPISEGTVYPILRRLTQEGLVESYLQESSEGPPRKYYRMTKEGRKHIDTQIRDWSEFVKSVDHLLKGKAEKDGSKTVSL